MGLFSSFDLDDSGTLHINDILQGDEEAQEQLLRICNMDRLRDVFEMLDYDDSGTVDIQDFCDGIMQVQSHKPAEIIRTMKQCSLILGYVKTIHEKLTSKPD